MYKVVSQKQTSTATAVFSAMVSGSSLFHYVETRTQIRVTMGICSASQTSRGGFHLLIVAH